MKNNLLNRRHILRQLKADLVGKDAYRGVSLTYAWLANQFGHFALGYIPVSVLYHTCFGPGTARETAFWVGVFWLCFELPNLLMPLLMGEKNGKHRRQKMHYTFNPDWPHLFFDTLTDLLFFWTGAYTAATVLEYSTGSLLIMTGLFLSLLYPSYYWYLSRIYLQCANYPLYMRLSQWNLPISEADRQTIKCFLKSHTAGRHLLVFGGGRSGKTSISVGLAHEIALERRPCYYISAMKLLSQCSVTDADIMRQQQTGWTWRHADLLLIDDLHPGDPVTDEFIEVERFFRNMDHPQLGQLNREALVNKNVIWVLGIEGDQQSIQRHWHDRLEEIGVKPENIYCINLADSEAQVSPGVITDKIAC